MKKHLKKIFSIVSILLLTIFSNNLFSQVYLLNEDFSSASGVKPPVGWNNITVTGTATDVWRYDNPGVRQVTFPVIGTFAIFDSENYSGPGGAEKVSLETPFVDCSFSPNIILYFDHVFKSNRSGKADVEIFDGTNWVIVKSFLDSVPVAKTESIDVSSLIGNKTGAKVRFTWQGDSSQYWIIDNVKLYAPLSKDVRLKTLNSPVTPVLAGVNPISITLSNEGYQTVTSTTIRWSANGISQTNYNWTGNIVRDSAQANIPIGTYNFPASSVTKLKVWVDNPNGTADLNKLNDTLDANLYTALCGTYTIGGVNPSFATFSDAVTALNNAGVTCPVVFKVRDGVYEEQIRIYDVKGSSPINTVTFESESGDSSKVQLLYQAANGTSDFVISFNRSGHIRFNGIGIRRVNGYGSVHVLEGAHHIGISDSWLTGNVYISTYGSDTAVSLRNNNIQGNNIDINRFGGDVLNGVYVEGNFFNSLSISNASNIYVASNRGGVDTVAYALNINLSGVSNAIIEGNKSNTIRANYSSLIKLLRNKISDQSDWGIVSGSSTNVEIRGNSLGTPNGILADNGDSIRVVGNRVFRSTPSSGHGILVQGAIRIFEADSNEIVNYGYGVTTRPSDGQLWKITNNKVMQTNIIGILLEGPGGQVSGNRVLGVSSGSGIHVSGQGLKIFNNYIQIGGDGGAKGLSLQPSGSGSSILFNSVNITGTDIVNGRALEVLGGDRYVIKNNIFANTGGGYAAYYNVPVSTFDLDYNNYYSSKSRLIYHNGSLFDTLSSFIVSVSKDINSFAVNPYYLSDTALQPSHILLDQSGIADPVVTFDILSAARNTIPDIGAKNFTLCSNDAGVDGFSGLSSSVNAGVSPIKITLVNHGTSVLTSAGIMWSVNGVVQPLFSWTGNLSSGQSAVVSIGSFNFSSGGVYKLRSWVSNVNGSVDCKPSNDTTSVVELGTALCGTYTIGGVNPSFATFSDAVTALNNAGVTCPVVFKVRDGVYEEQIRIYDVKGSSPINTVTFESESGDSSKVQLLYQAANGTSDFVISFNRSGHIRFNGIGIRRVNGYGSVHVLEGAHHIGISDSWLTGNVYISTYGSDTAVSLRNNNIQGNNIDINRFGGDVLNGVYVEGNFFNSLSISNASNIYVASNRGGVDTVAYALNINLSGVSNAIIEGNKSNTIRANYSSLIKLLRNKISDQSDWGIVSGSSTNVEIRGNSLGTPNGILADNGDSIRVVGNRVFRSTPSSGHGILVQGAIRIFEADSNEIVNYGYGVTTRPSDGQLWKITNNKVMQTNIIGILLEGPGGQVSGNRVLGVSSGSGIHVSGQGLKIFNNYIQIGGDGGAKGLSLQPSGSGSSILFNSVNITGTDIVNGRALEVLGGDRYVIKNNIFANTGGGYAAYYNVPVSTFDLDYNNYYSSKSRLIYHNGSLFDTLSSFIVSVSKDINSFAVNPYYLSDTALQPSHILLDQSGIADPVVTFDILSAARNTIPDIGAKNFTLCSNDAGVDGFSGLSSSVNAGVSPIKITLVNHGTSVLTSAGIMWSVNGVVQPLFSWTGNLSSGQSAVVSIGSFNFSSGGVYKLRSWVSNVNGSVDCKPSNDTTSVVELGTALCGTYTIGGVNPSFATFSDAVTALNNAGVTCPVVFKVRDGVYEEQIRIYDVKGSSPINTVTFESESGDSSKVQLLYQAANGTSDFVISFNRSGHIRFNGIGIRRVNGYGSVHVLEGAHHIGISDSWLTGNVYISTYGSDTAVSLRNNNIQGNNIDINRFGGDVLNGVYVEGNFFNSLSISNASNIYVASNRGGVDTVAYALNINLSGVSNAIIEGNKSNTIRANYSSLIKLLRNKISDQSDWGIVSGSSTNVEIRGNSLGTPNGILADNGDSIRVVGNRVFRSTPSSGHGILVQGAIRIFEADSNEIVNYGYGVTTRPSDGQLWKITNNKVMQTNIIGILLEGPGGQVSGNRVLGVSSGSGIHVSGQGLKIFNNYIQIGGDGGAKGLSLQPSGSGSSILFNSVNITGTDIVNGRALEVLGGDRYVIKNNIFANTGGGYAAYFASTPGVKDIDYNNYFSTGNSFGYLGGQSLNNITSWGVALNSDANSKNLNPNYKADTALLPFQKQFNGAGISSGNILLDIDGEIRNQQAPDIGAQEFMVDFGVTRLVSPTNDCFQKDSTPVTIYLRQFGDIPFIDLKLAYQVNNGPVFKDTIPGAISNDLEYTFKRPQDMSTNGEYLFKIWLEENGDDNLNNDTLVVLRKNKNAPRVDFNYVTQCAGIGVPFTGTAAIDTGFIARIEWEFGDSTIGVGYTPSHIYDTSGTYTVTMRAFSDQGCFSEVKKAIVLKSTPITSFSVKDACFGTAVKPVNNSLIKEGGTISNYVWKWGDGQTATGFEPTHQYAISDTFDITLIATASNGCVDSVTNKSITYSLENTAFKLNKPAQDFICEGSSLKLSASGASSYLWLFNKLPIDGAFDSVYQATKAGDYAVVFVNGLGCRSNATQPLKIKFNPIPEAKFNFDSYCVGASIQFRDSSKVDSLNRVSYTWNFGDGSPAQQVGNPVYTYTKEGEYKVSLIIKSMVCINQADTLEKTIKVELPIRGKRYEPVTVLENKSKKLEAREFGVKYQWNPSTYLDNPNIAEPKYTAGKEQTYTIKITAKSGCITIDTLQVALYSKCDIRAPEGFSPNDDGKNDKFYPFQIGIKNMQVFRVYDRFGNLVYDDKNANSSNGWDGKHKGKKLPIGTYVWVAEGIGEDDIPVKRSGNVILIK